jgi:hypothetical protein
MHPAPNFSYRSLELLCRQQAALAATASTRRELECMALEYKELADRLDRQQPSWAGGSPHDVLSAGSELNDPARHE